MSEHETEGVYHVQRKTGFQTTTTTFAEALSFVMGKLDAVGEEPMVNIQPQMCHHSEDEHHIFFEVTVEGISIETERKVLEA